MIRLTQTPTAALLHDQIRGLIGELRQQGLNEHAASLGPFLDAGCWTTGTELVRDLEPALRRVFDCGSDRALPVAMRQRLLGCIGLISMLN